MAKQTRKKQEMPKAAQTISALFRDRLAAEESYRSLQNYGYEADEISVVMSEATRDQYYKSQPIAEHLDDDAQTEEKAVKGLGAGAVVGGGIGVALGMIAAIGTAIVVPGAGLVVAGPLAASLGGVGGVIGTALGALYGSGVPEETEREYEYAVNEGGIIISVRPHTDEESERINDEWRDRGAELISS